MSIDLVANLRSKMKSFFRTIKKIVERFFGTKTDESFWRYRHLFDHKWTQKYIDWLSINQPHRQFVVEKIFNFSPFETVLEIGCASGPNLYLLAKKFPNTKFYGIDISKKAIETGRRYFKNKNIKNVFLSHARADDLKSLPNQSIDIIFTDAVLVCIGPDKIKTVIKEIVRVARKAIILTEWHSEQPKSFSIDFWVHNYKLLFKDFFPEKQIKFTKIPENLWQGGWIKYGYIIEIKI